MTLAVSVDSEAIAGFCRRWGVAELALFGSVLGEKFDPQRSDVDVLVTFQADARIGLFELVDMQDELAEIFGRRVDLVPREGLKPRIRESVLASAHSIYGAA